MTSRQRRLQRARLYLICDPQPEAFLRAVLRGGVDIVQLRSKNAGAEEILAASRLFARACAEYGALFIINDHPELVAEARADGAHVGQEDVSVTAARELLGPDLLIGLSTHSPAQIRAAGEAGVDYVGVGPVHATPTKPGRAAVGLELVRVAARQARVPWFAIGGIDPGNVGAVSAAGATRVAVVRALTEAADPELAARDLVRALPGEPSEVRLGAA